jgi:arabinan endo-1,5-alpha-L-arabinosidase
MVSSRRRALGASAVFVACLNVSLVASAAPKPVYAPGGTSFADPSVVSHNNQFYGMATGSLVPSAQGDIGTGPWRSEGPALTSKPSWATGVARTASWRTRSW